MSGALLGTTTANATDIFNYDDLGSGLNFVLIFSTRPILDSNLLKPSAAKESVAMRKPKPKLQTTNVEKVSVAKEKASAKEESSEAKAAEHKCGEGKCGEGKCGGDDKKEEKKNPDADPK